MRREMEAHSRDPQQLFSVNCCPAVGRSSGVQSAAIPLSPKPTINDLSDELLVMVILRVEDIDIQTIAKLGKRFRRLATNPYLWSRDIIQARNRTRVETLLSDPCRATRRELITRGVIKAFPRVIEEGQYVASCNYLRRVAAAEALKKSMIQIIIKRLLLTRPDPDSFAGDLLPKISMMKIAPSILVRAVKLDVALRKASLSRKINQRPTIFQAAQLFLGSTWITAWMLCPSVKGKIKYFESLKPLQPMAVSPSY